MDYTLILKHLFPDAQWAVTGDGYDGITWLSDGELPSQELLDAAWPDVQLAEALKVLRAERDRRLQECDWTQLPDAPVDKAAWAAYRQALRDLPGSVDPFNPVWPAIP